MTLEPDYITDRRRLRRRLTVWRIAAIVGVLAIVLVAVGEFEGLFERDHIVRVDVDGIIVDDEILRLAIESAGRNDHAKAIILRINSPGGTTVGGEALYEALQRAGTDKPIVAVIGTLGTSAGYMIALAADHIIARETSMTGSIGVLLQTTEITGLLEKIGISAETIKSTTLKGTPSPFEELSPEGRAAAQAMVDDVYAWFVDLFAERRGMPRETALGLADGRVFTGRQALSARLIDGIGGTREAIAWLESARGIKAGLPVWRLEQPERGNLLIDLIATVSKKTLLSERLRLDGLISVWQPDRYVPRLHWRIPDATAAIRRTPGGIATWSSRN